MEGIQLLSDNRESKIKSPQKHRNLYLEDGTLVMQVENVIFKVHRSILAQYSKVIQDMIALPGDGESKDGTEENPLVLIGDTAASWERLLKIPYGVPRLKSERIKGEHLLEILTIAHKYCMEEIEADIIEELKTTPSYDGLVDIVVASQIVGSKELYDEGIRRIIAYENLPTLQQAKRIGSAVIAEL
ncbi:hypothetical protein FRC17_008370 [Serendipita sp. 399]|nr:hypothetical protein FRC17_008370 [Serendipita sp. 399]